MDTGDRALIVEMVWVTLLTSAGVRLVGTPRTQRWLRSWAARHREEVLPADLPAALSRVARCQRIVRKSGGFDGTCLVRSLTLWTLLRKRGVCAEIHIGVRKNKGAIEAHAWVEHDGIPVNEARDVRLSYQAFGEPFSFDRWA